MSLVEGEARLRPTRHAGTRQKKQPQSTQRSQSNIFSASLCALCGYIRDTCWASITPLSKNRLPAASRDFRARASACVCVHVWQIRAAPFFSVLMGDSRGYDEWARRIAGGDWIGHEVFYQAPLYPYLLGVIYARRRPQPAARPHRAGGDRIGVVRAARRSPARGCSRARVGIAAGLMLALYAPAIFFDGLLQKSVLDVFFVCLALWLISRTIRRRSRRDAETSQNATSQRVSAISAVIVVCLARARDGRAGADARERARVHRRHRRWIVVRLPAIAHVARHSERAAVFLAGRRARAGLRSPRATPTSAAASTSRRRSSGRTSTSATTRRPTARISRCASDAARRSTSGRTPPSSPSARSAGR